MGAKSARKETFAVELPSQAKSGGTIRLAVVIRNFILKHFSDHKVLKDPNKSVF